MRVAAVASLVLLMLASSGCFGALGGGVGPKDYLTGSYAKWLVEVDYESGAGPSDSLLTFLHDRLAPLVTKPDGVVFSRDDALPAQDRAWSDDELLAYAKSHKDQSTGGGQVVTHLLFVAGHSAHDDGNGKVLGLTYDHDVIVIFMASIKSGCSVTNVVAPCTNPNPMIQATVLHEFGHALGLVDNGIPMAHPHEDPDHKGHSVNHNSVMYWAVETNDIFTAFTGGVPQDFDADDRADLHLAGGP